MLLVGLILLGIGSVGVCAAVTLELRRREPIYRLLMKVFPWLFGIGAVITAISLGT